MTIEQFAVSVILSVIVIIPTTLVAISGRRTGKHQDFQSDVTSMGMMQQQVYSFTEKMGALQAKDEVREKEIERLRARDATRESEMGVLLLRVNNQGRRIKLYEKQRTEDQAEIHSLKAQVDDLPKSVERLRQQLRDNNILPEEDPHADAAMQAIEAAKLTPKDDPPPSSSLPGIPPDKPIE